MLVVFVRFSGAPGTVTFTGYTQLASDVSDASDDQTMVFWRYADGTEGATNTLTTGNSIKLGAICWGVTGANNEAPTISTVAIGTTTANTANPGSVAPTSAPRDTLYLAMAGGDGETAYTAAPTNYTNFIAANSGTTGAVGLNVVMGGGSRALTASSSDDPGAFTHGAHAAGWTAYTAALRALVTAQATVSFFEFEIPQAPAVTNLTPASITRTRALGSPALALRPAGLTHTRAQGAPKANPQAKPAGLAHTRGQGAAKVNTQGKPAGLSRTRALGSTSLLLLQFIRPDADLAAAGWTAFPTSPTTLYDKVNDQSGSTYITATAA